MYAMGVAGYNYEGGKAMSQRLSGKRIAIFIEDLFEESELLEPMHFLTGEGATVVVVGPGRAPSYRGKHDTIIDEDVSASTISARDFDAFIVPGGYAPGKMRRSNEMVQLIADADDLGKLIAAICHGPQMLISANILRGRMATCADTIAVDVRNAGALHFDESVVIDGHIITSRSPADIPDFNNAIADRLISGTAAAGLRGPMVAGA
jgi:protease I